MRLNYIKESRNMNTEVIVEDKILKFTPYAVTSLNSSSLKDELLKQFELADKISINLSQVSQFDTAGIQLIKSLSKSALEHNKDCNIETISQVVEHKIKLLGIKL